MKRYTINTKRTYEKDGQEKTAWLRVGTLTRFPENENKKESFIMELNMFPHTKFFIFADEPKEEKAEDKPDEVEPDEVSGEEIPF